MTLIAFILGAGGNVGHAVAKKLIGEGYKVAAASRNPDAAAAKEIGYHPVKLDLSNPADVPEAFAEVEREFGAAPNVVIYNAYAITIPTDPQNILAEVPTEKFSQDLNVNVVSLWAAAQAAVASWEKLDSALPKVFILTGNSLPWLNSIPTYATLGVGKAASAHIINTLADTYGKRGLRFYFTLQIAADGDPLIGIDGAPTADVYSDLIKRSEQGHWRIAFDKNGKDWTEELGQTKAYIEALTLY